MKKSEEPTAEVCEVGSAEAGFKREGVDMESHGEEITTRFHHGGMSAGPGGMGDWNMVGRRFNKLDMLGAGMKHSTNRSLFIFNEGNFIRKSAQTIIEWGYPLLKCNYIIIDSKNLIFQI